MGSFILTGVGILTGILAAVACKVSPYSSSADGKNSEINIKGFVAIAICIFDIRVSNPQEISEALIMAVVTFLFFVLGFYLIYGIMSVLKVSGENTDDRRSKAFWVNAAISTALSFLAY